MQVVYYPPDGLQTTLRSVADTNSIPTTTTTTTSTNTNTTNSTNTNSAPTTSSSSTTDIISDAKEFIQDNSTYLLIGVGVIVLFIALRN